VLGEKSARGIFAGPNSLGQERVKTVSQGPGNEKDAKDTVKKKKNVMLPEKLGFLVWKQTPPSRSAGGGKTEPGLAVREAGRGGASHQRSHECLSSK